MLDKILSANGRKTIYSVALAASPLAVAYGYVSNDKAALWVALVAALLGFTAPAVALANVTPDAPKVAPVDPALAEGDGDDA